MKTTKQGLIEVIEQAGFEAVKRDTVYKRGSCKFCVIVLRRVKYPWTRQARNE